jgi:hypothetical protein
MKVISIFKKHSFDELAADFAHLFEVNCRQKLSDETLELWKGLYNKWVAEYQPQTTPYHIRIISRWEHCSPMCDMNCAVFEKRDLRGCGAVFAHDSRNEFLNMSVGCDRDVELTETELAAGLFYEMTYYPPEKELPLPFGRKKKS